MKKMPPICVDLDGTLIRSDLLLESFLLILKKNILYLFLIPFWLLKGKATLKAEIAKRIEFNPATLPYSHNFLLWLKNEHLSGRELWLCTASNTLLAHKIADHLKIFKGVLASTDTTNLSGAIKANALVMQFGENEFEYCGNSRVDLAVWRFSRAAVVVNARKQLTRKAQLLTEIRAVFEQEGNKYISIIKALRLHQWSKNVLVFVPLIAAHKLNDVVMIYQATIAFLAFNFCASSVYILNDMLDLEVDRQHPRKTKRPFAAGDVSLLTGFLAAPALLACTALLVTFLPPSFALAIAVYYALTFIYSFYLKKLEIIDVLTLAGLYTARIIAGAVAIGVTISFWLLLFSMFLFLCLAFVKRYAELNAIQSAGKLHTAGRGYHVTDLPLIHSMGIASGYLCILVLALYINTPSVTQLYRNPEILWALCIVFLFWISRIWVKAHRGEMHDDPVIFAVKDRGSLVCGLCVAGIVLLAMQ